MSNPKLSLPIVVGKQYVRRDGKTTTAEKPPKTYYECLVRVAATDEILLGAYPESQRLAYKSNGRVNIDGSPHPFDLMADAAQETQHPHADLIDEYAQDWKTCGTPWVLWEHFIGNGIWVSCQGHPFWEHESQYRRKPRQETITINGQVLNAPVRCVPDDVTEAWYINLQGVYEVTLNPKRPDEHNYKCNSIFHTREDAEAMRLVLVALMNPQGKP